MYQENNLPNRIKNAIQKYKDEQHALGNDKVELPQTVKLNNTSEYDAIKHLYSYIEIKDDTHTFRLHNQNVYQGYIYKQKELENPSYAPEYYTVLEDYDIGGWRDLVCLSEFYDGVLLNKMDSTDLFICNENYKITPFDANKRYYYNGKTVVFFNYYGHTCNEHSDLDVNKSKMVIYYRASDGEISEKTIVPLCCKYK